MLPPRDALRWSVDGASAPRGRLRMSNSRISDVKERVRLEKVDGTSCAPTEFIAMLNQRCGRTDVPQPRVGEI
jgi:hypothetical protein